MTCIIVDDELMSCKVLEMYAAKIPGLEVLGLFSNPVEALSFLKKNQVDVLFLDIEMPEMNGIELIKNLNTHAPLIILTTSRRDFAPEAYANNVTYYLLKPFEFVQFQAAISKAKETFAAQGEPLINDHVLFLKKGKSMVRVSPADILYLEALGDYVEIYTHKEKFILKTTLTALEFKLPAADYMRVHRSYIARLDKIDKIEDETIYYDKKEIPIGKSYHKEVMSRIKLL